MSTIIRKLKIPGFRGAGRQLRRATRLLRRLAATTLDQAPALTRPFPDGHFYSPIVDPAELQQRESEIWSTDLELPGIDFRPEAHRTILREWFRRHLHAYDYPEHLPETSDLTRFFTRNSQFSWLDSRALFVFLNEWRPRRMIEVGSGFSSLLTADVNTRFLGGALDFTCIEPYPREFLKHSVRGITCVTAERVETVPVSTFDRLEHGDILFIDSSHVAKTGSDVTHLVFEVLPRLKSGVLIHFHDIFLPAEYPKNWVLRENRSWNEQYLIRALLMYSTAFRIVFSCSFAYLAFPDLVAEALGVGSGRAFGGGSLWLERL